MNLAIENLERILANGQDNALLRFGLGKAYLDAKVFPAAIEHLLAAIDHDPTYSAAWKLLGKAYAEDGQQAAAKQTFEKGIVVAEARGDIQAAKEMRVYLRRLDR